MLQITRPQPPVLRGALAPEKKEILVKAGFFVGVVGLLSGFVWLTSR